MCSNAINKQLKTLPEVVTVETDLNTNTFTVTLKEGNDLSQKYLRKKWKSRFCRLFSGHFKAETITKSAYILVNDKLSNAVKYNLKYLTKDL
jgi:copper chaperone CopZ